MAEQHSYEIVVKLSPGSGSKKKKENTPVSTREKIAEGLKVVKNNIAFKEITGIAQQAASFTVSNIGLTTGNTESQQWAEFAMSGLSMAGTALFSVITGNILPFALSIVNKGISIAFKQAQINLEQNIENESLALSRQRAGVAFNQSRMGGAG